MNNMFCIVCGSQKLKWLAFRKGFDDVDVYQVLRAPVLHPLQMRTGFRRMIQDTQTKAVYNSKSINLRKIMANSRYDTAESRIIT